MNKKILLSLMIPVAAVVLAVLWLLSATVPDYFGWFSVAWAGAIACGILGTYFLFGGIFGRNFAPLKKFSIIIGAGFLVLALICLTFVIVIPDNIIAPIIAIILAAALLLGVLFTGGNRWDSGDNQKAGYKNYRQRKAEEAAQAEKQAKKDAKKQANE